MISTIRNNILPITFISISLFLACFFGLLYYYGPYLTQKTQALLNQHQGRIVISLTTTPYRIHKVNKTLNSLKQQSIQPDAVYLNIPDIFARENIPYTIPATLANDPYITIVRGQDYGPATKLLPTLKQETDPNTIIITVDDDHSYHKQILRDLILGALSSTQTAITTTGLHAHLVSQADKDIFVYTGKCNCKESDLVLGYSGVAYKRSLFEDDIFSFTADNHYSCFLSDDFMFAVYLRSKHINIKSQFPYWFGGSIFALYSPSLPQSSAIDALHMGANSVAPHPSTLAGYSQCLASLLADTKKQSYAAAYIDSISKKF